ncbi:MAG: LLM class flavin-dependent oxidoreductase [Chloroflexota bacterium]|nr:LLM class flavin-dependent oxidoreductase [Chloroflexota bacterium]
MAALDFGIVMRATARGGTLADLTTTNDRILGACAQYDLTAWVVDHLQFDSVPLLESFSLLAYSAGRQPGVQFGTLVLGQSFRNPALTAKIASSLQFLTGGRFILGIGAGWQEAEYRAYGYAYRPASVRISQLEESVQVIRALWTEAPATFVGTHFQVNGAYCEPRPRPAPTLMIGGAGEQRTLRVVARYADWWNADYYTPEEYQRKLGILQQYCKDIERDPSRIAPTYYAAVSLSRAPGAPVANLPFSHRTDLAAVTGTPDGVTRQLETFAALGVQHVQLSFLDFPDPSGLELFLGHVLPRFSRITQKMKS